MQNDLMLLVFALNLVWAVVFAAFYLRRSQGGATAAAEPEESAANFHELVEEYQELLDLVLRRVGLQGKSLADADRLVSGPQPGLSPELKAELAQRLSEIIVTNEQLRQNLLAAQLKLCAQHEELDRARVESRIDHLTELPNRRASDEKIRELQACQERLSSGFALAIFDLDHFKALNDTHGHAMGDAVLRAISKALSEIRRSTDFLGRIGGEEFALLIPRIGLPECQTAAERYRNAVETTKLRTGGQTLSVTASFGIALSRPGEPFSELMTRADEALYAAKRSGRNQIGIHDGETITCVSRAVADFEPPPRGADHPSGPLCPEAEPDSGLLETSAR
ncbi:MAG TPA: GGDEF domain-containing protein [Pirellulales bacterium]|nr:GGDEF domain-containing protein [Pirellulales bacterium]